ncbi:probable bifunctional dTTP/UTP pyrophosphatase/methyltransferase protein [Ochotona princeps]|uniref:probable bifunctional dTTP/UTP pyrophosphatase/methyltransferase protein n=1 Tax=Ochotona princeps TaxID=9978 RepID=UPI0027150698|nr:probable bifunctional dTTP/UTP pyrophosphatase/methyltransferase protein [Ochotona princeps]
MVLSAVIGKLQHKRVVLASASPRRREILNNAGLQFEVVPSRFRETLDKTAFPSAAAYAEETAKHKALEVATRMHQKDQRAPDVVIGADTVVAVSGLILEKPVDKQDAYRMLTRLSGREHSVFTGVAVVLCTSAEGRLHTHASAFSEETRVRFSELSEELVWEHVLSGEPMDKAGGYGLQARGGMLVESVLGDALNVIGFPLNRFCRELPALLGPEDPKPQNTQEDSKPLQDPTGDAAIHSEPQDPFTGYPAKLVDLMEGFKASKVLFTACQLRVFDLLQEMSPLTARELAGRVEASVLGTERLLEACVGLGLLEKTALGYSNSALAAAHLLSGGELSLHDLALHLEAESWPLFSHLEAAVRKGTVPWTQSLKEEAVVKQALGVPLPGLACPRTARRVAGALDLSCFASACCMGGGTDVLASALALEYPRMRVTAWAGSAGPTPTHDLPVADLYVASGLLQAPPDARTEDALRALVGCCPPGGGLLLVEATTEEEEKEATPRTRMLALELLLRAGAQPRTLARCRELLAGLELGTVRTAPAGPGLGVLLCTRTPDHPGRNKDSE